MPALGYLAELYQQATQYISQHRDVIDRAGAITALVIIPLFLLGYHLKPTLNVLRRYEREAISQLESLSVAETLGVPASKIPNRHLSAEVALYIHSGGERGSVQRVPTIYDKIIIKQYADRVRKGEDGLNVLHRALKGVEIQKLFTQKQRI